MAYPRELNLSEETKIELQKFLDRELMTHYLERGNFISEIIDMQHAYWAAPSDEAPDFPFPGCSNIIVPLSAIAVEAIHYRLMNTLFGIPQFTTVKSVSANWDAGERALEQFFDKEFKDYMNIRKPITDTGLEWNKFGTCVGKPGYERITKMAVRPTEDGKEEEEFEVVIKQGACINAVPLSRFLMPFANLDPQTAQWCGEEHSKTPFEIATLEKSGFFREGTYEKLKAWVTQQSLNNARDFEKSQESLENREIVWPSLIGWAEIWCAWNVDEDLTNKTKEIVVHYHRESGTFMSIRYNWHYDLYRPYETEAFMPVENRWTGIGTIKQSIQFQEEVTAKHRQLLDNATLANARMIKVSRLSGYQPGEPIYPGKMWIVDDPSDIDVFQLGEVYPSGYNTEQAPVQWFQQRTQVNEVTQGMPQVGTPGTATSDLSRIQEGSKKFGYLYTNYKGFVDRLLKRSVLNMRQFGVRDVRYYENAEGGNWVEQFFMQDPDLIKNELLVTIRSAGQMDNKLLDRQNLVLIGQQYQQYASGTMSLIQMLQNPQLIQAAIAQILQGSNEIMRQLFESYDMRNIDRILLSPEILNVVNQGINQGQPQGLSSPAGVGAVGGMGGINSLFPATT